MPAATSVVRPQCHSVPESEAAPPVDIEPQDVGELDDLEAAADRLLESAGALGRETGAYTESQMRRKIRRDANRAPRLDACAVSEKMVDFLFQRQVEELIDVSRLTVRQELVFRLHVHGLGIRRITATLKIGRYTAARALRVAKRRVRAAYQEGRYAGWYEVYLSEVNRPAYRRR